MMSKEDVLTHTSAGDEVDGYGGGVCVGVGWWWVQCSAGLSMHSRGEGGKHEWNAELAHLHIIALYA